MTDPVLIRAGSDEQRDSISNIVFVHGMGGNEVTTWQFNSSSWWPDWVAESQIKSAVWSLGYDAAATKWIGNSMPLYDRALNILALLEANDFNDKPITFITHSFGGLVVKKMLEIASTSGVTSWEALVQNTNGIVFLSTPHGGSKYANYLNGLGKILGVRPTPTISALEKNTPELRQLNTWFRNHVNNSNIPIQVFYETLDTKKIRIVDEFSSDPDLPDVRLIPVDADHLGICKPKNESYLVHKSLTYFLNNDIVHDPNSYSHDINDVDSNLIGIADKVTLYKENITREISSINILSVIKPRQHKDVFVELSLIENFNDPELTAESEADTYLDEKLNLSSVVGDCGTGTVVLGEPGSGKSTLISEIVLRHCEGKLPIILKSKHLNQDSVFVPKFKLLQCICNALNEYGMDVDAADTKKIINVADIVLLIDGLDEIPKEFRNSFVSEVCVFKNSHANTKIIITSRPSGYTKGSAKNFQHTKILRFTNSNIDQFILRWFEESIGVRFRQYLYSDRELLDLAANPLILTMMVIVFEHGHENRIPKTTTELYSKFIHIMLSYWDKEKGIKRNNYAKNVKVCALGALAYFQKKDDINQFISDVQIASIATHIDSQSTTNMFDLINEIMNNSGLLVQRSMNRFDFWHKSVADYFCANYMVTHELPDELESKIDDEEWRAVHLFYFGLAHNLTRLFDRYAEIQKDREDRFRSKLVLLSLCFYEDIYKFDGASLQDKKTYLLNQLQSAIASSEYTYLRTKLLRLYSKFQENAVYTTLVKMFDEFRDKCDDTKMKEVLLCMDAFPYSTASNMLQGVVTGKGISEGVKSYAAFSLAAYNEAENIKYLNYVLGREDTTGLVKSAVTIALGRLNKESAFVYLGKLWKDESVSISERVRAAGSLARAGDEDCVEFLENIVVLPKWIRGTLKIPESAKFSASGGRRRRTDATLNARKSALISLSHVTGHGVSTFFKDILSLGSLSDSLSAPFANRNDWMARSQSMRDKTGTPEKIVSNLRKETIWLLPRVDNSYETVLFLNKLLGVESKNEIREEIYFSLGRLGDESKYDELVSIYNKATGVRRKKYSLLGLAGLNHEMVLPYLEEKLTEESIPQIRDAAFSCIALKNGLIGDDLLTSIY